MGTEDRSRQASPGTEIVIRVRFRCGAYHASGGGKRASSTCSPDCAAYALAMKISPDAPFTMDGNGETAGIGASTWRLRVRSMP